MIKITILGLFLVANLHAISYEELLEDAIKNNLQLQINNSQEEQLALHGKIATRYENPNLELGLSNFSERRIFRDNEFGASVEMSQVLLLPSVKVDRRKLTQKKINVAIQNNRLEKSEFIYAFNMKYLNYKEEYAKEALLNEELEILQNIVNIKEQRFSKGSIPKSEFLEAKIDKTVVKSHLNELLVSINKKKNALFLFANMTKTSDLETYHTFVKSYEVTSNPLLELTQKKKELAESELALASHNIEEVEFFTEMENEPDEDVLKIGISIPLPIFNKKSEEKQLAKIAIKNEELRLTSQQQALELQVAQLENEINKEEDLRVSYEELVLEKRALLSVYAKGYALAKVNLLEINEMKKDILKTKGKILESKFEIEKNIIKLNYLKGAIDD